MLVFVAMGGVGERYRRAGYSAPKPLISVCGAPMIERVLEAFPRDSGLRYLFGVNRVHAETTDLLSVLRRLRPEAQVVVMEPHKDGPVQSVLACAEQLAIDEDVCVNYCDFGVRWSFADFADWLAREHWDVALSGYRGFHPHSLGPTLYAYLRSQGDRVLEIREKHHFTADKFQEFASAGLYWFRSGRELLRLSRELVASGERVNGEFYVSTVVQRAIAQGARAGVYELTRFFQWGTPEDLRDYEAWADTLPELAAFVERARLTRSPATLVVPMAGRGQRFIECGYADPKPLISVAGRPMVEQALRMLPTPHARVLVVQPEHASDARFSALLQALPGPTHVVQTAGLTAGQSISARLGAAEAERDRPLLCAPCDAGYVYDLAAWSKLEQAGDIDMIVWTARAHLPAIWRPQMYGWLAADETRQVRAVAVKRTLEGIPVAEQEVIVGTFWFRDARTFLHEVDAQVAADDRVNGEFYVDTIARRMCERGARVLAFAVDKYMPWGTPAELSVFDYWNAVHRAGRTLPSAEEPRR